jgi:hypothetical protein
MTLTVLLLACTSGTEPDDWRRVVGHVNPALSSIQAVSFPAQVQANVPFPVTVTTLGSSSCTRADGASVSRSDNLAIITPYDRVAPDGTACTRDLRGFPRTVMVRFGRPGEARLRFPTRNWQGESDTIEFSLTVH